jgi:hypothetical protein
LQLKFSASEAHGTKPRNKPDEEELEALLEDPKWQK